MAYIKLTIPQNNKSIDTRIFKKQFVIVICAASTICHIAYCKVIDLLYYVL